MGELHRIVRQDAQALGEPGRITAQGTRQGLDLHETAQPLGLGSFVRHGNHVGRQGAHVQLGFFQVKFAGLDF